MPKTAVALFIFNRPLHTQRVFSRIREYQPSRLFVIADGPRFDEEAPQCIATRTIVEQVDWDCDILTNFSDVNLGCNHRLPSGLDWVFDQCDEAIILEDDCLPHLSFFHYCHNLLKRYRDDTRIMMINGSNLQFDRQFTPYSYYFSRYTHVWGWATWGRAWRYYSAKIALWPLLRKTTWLQDMVGSNDAAAYWRIIFDSTLAGGTTWDYAWTFSCWAQNGLTITPHVNLVSNIGFDETATHARDATYHHHFADKPTAELAFPLRHPPYIVRHREADLEEFKNLAPHDMYHQVRRMIAATLPESTRTQIARALSTLTLRR